MRKTSDELFEGRQGGRNHLRLLLVEAGFGGRGWGRGQRSVCLVTDDDDGSSFASDVRHHIDRDSLVHEVKKVRIVRRSGEETGTVTTIRKGGRPGRGPGRIHGV